MSTLHRRQGLHVTSAETATSSSNSFLEKHQDFSQVQDNQPISQSQFLHVQNADRLTESSYQRKLRISMGNNYSGLHIYDMEDSE